MSANRSSTALTENAAYAQRCDARRVAKGKASTTRKAYQQEHLPMATIRELCEEEM